MYQASSRSLDLHGTYLRTFVYVWLGVSLGFGGCARTVCRPSAPAEPCWHPPTFPLASQDDLQRVFCDVTQVPVSSELAARAYHHIPSTNDVYQLSAEACQFQGSRHCSEADLLEHKADALEQEKSHGDSATRCLTATVCRDIAQHLRNRAAADSLRLYFRLLQTEAQRPWVDQACDELVRALDDHRRYTTQGMALPIDAATLDEQRHTMQDRREQLWLASAQLQSGLRLSLGLCANDLRQISPSSTIRVQEIVCDPEATVATGLAQRHDLIALRRLCHCPSTNVLQQSGNLLMPLDPALAILNAGPNTSAGPSASQPSDICCTLQHREQAAESEIRQSLDTIESSLLRVAMAREEVVRLRRHLADLEAKRGTDHVTLFDLVAARLRIYQSEATLAEMVVNWQLAHVSRWEACGALVGWGHTTVGQTAPSESLPPVSHLPPVPAENPPHPEYTP